MPTPQKVETIADLRELLKTSSGVIFTDYRGMTDAEIKNLRKELRTVDSTFMVVKNTLFLRAAKQVSDDPALAANLIGPTAASFALKDSVATAKFFVKYLADNRTAKFSLKGGFVGGRFFDPAQVEALSKMPPREQLIAELLGQLDAPITSFVSILASIDPMPGIVGTMEAIVSEFVGTIAAIAEKVGADAPAAEAAPVAA